MKKPRTYYLTLSQTFPATHPRKGEPTYFKEKVMDAICVAHGIDRRPKGIIDGLHGYKLHTIRGNYDRWYKIFEQIYAGEACLSLRVWSGKPYRSKMIEIARLTKDDGIGIQKLEFMREHDGGERRLALPMIEGHGVYTVSLLANNDGLTLEDWLYWFRNYDLSKPLAIIHFTKFRY